MLPQAEEIYRANAESHDSAAETHDRAVPYIYRRSTRRHYWELLCQAFGGSEALRGRAVVELGCGTGTYTDLVLQHGAARFTGLDLSPRMLELARQKTPDPRCQWELAPLDAFSAAHAGEFDLAYSFSFLHHLPDVREGLQQIERLLKPGGIYAALHELILPHSPTLMEKFDEKLESVFGSAVNDPAPFLSRLYRALPGRITGRRGPAPVERGPDLVDFQLNQPFDLETVAGRPVEVRGYCYYAFPWLRHLSATINHRLLILRKPLA